MDVGCVCVSPPSPQPQPQPPPPPPHNLQETTKLYRGKIMIVGGNISLQTIKYFPPQTKQRLITVSAFYKALIVLWDSV